MNAGPIRVLLPCDGAAIPPKLAALEWDRQQPLTSMGEAELEQVGLLGPPRDAVRRLAVLSVEAGAQALVCSPHEVTLLRSEVGPDITLITPGVRPAGADKGDQSRVATPEEAIEAGADLLVIGRPITRAADPGAAAASIAAAVRRAGIRG